jgi:hypothetical protein
MHHVIFIKKNHYEYTFYKLENWLQKVVIFGNLELVHSLTTFKPYCRNPLLIMLIAYGIENNFTISHSNLVIEKQIYTARMTSP